MTVTAPYWNPYKAGLALGLVLLATFVLVGRGLGASGAFLRVTAEGVRTVAPAHAARNPVLRSAADSGDGLSGWLVVEIAGVLIGGALSARQAGRWRSIVERGPGTVRLARLGLAFGGGAIMGIGARLARLATEPDYIASIGLAKHLSPTRSNGLAALLAFIRDKAREAT